MVQWKRFLCGALAATMLVSVMPGTTAMATEVSTETESTIPCEGKCFVTFLDEDGNVIETQQVDKGSSAIAPSLTKEGYSLSWTKSFADVEIDMITQAVWTKKSYTVTYMDGDTIAKVQTVKYGESATAPVITKTGYTLSWDKTADNVTENTVIQAIWNPTEYKITYVTNGATNDWRNVPTYRFGQQTTLYKATLAGYTFDGWYTNSAFTGNPVEYLPTTAVGDKILYAKMTKVSLAKAKITKAKLDSSKTYATIKWKTVKGATKYKVEVSTSKKFKKVVKSYTSKRNMVRIKKLNKKKTYYVRIKTYKKDSTGKQVVASTSAVKKLKK